MKLLNKELIENACYYSVINYGDNYEHENKNINGYTEDLDYCVRGIVTAIFKGEVDGDFSNHRRFVTRAIAEKQVKEFLINHIKNYRKDLLELKDKIKAIGEIYNYEK